MFLSNVRRTLLHTTVIAASLTAGLGLVGLPLASSAQVTEHVEVVTRPGVVPPGVRRAEAKRARAEAKAHRVHAARVPRVIAAPVMPAAAAAIVRAEHPVVVGKKEKRPHLRAALRHLMKAEEELRSGREGLGALREARRELDKSSSNPAYHDRRSEAIRCVGTAAEVLERRGQRGEALALTSEAIQHVQFCLSAP